MEATKTMDAQHERYWELLARYLKDDISDEEKTTLLAWVEQTPENKEVFYRTLHLWQLTGKARDAFQPDVNQAWARFRQTVAVPETPSETETETPALPLGHGAATHRRVAAGWLRVAAGLLVLVLAGTLYWFYPARPPAAPTVYATGAVKKDFLLPDGSRVYLNRHSRLTYDKAALAGHRNVTLQGEAFFQVKRNAARPFVIHTAQARVQVLGTSFTVREDARRGTTEVAVVTGKVAFSGRRPTDTTRLQLLPGYRGMLTRQRQLVRQPIADPNFRAWQADKLVFNDTRLGSVIETMERYFDIRIEVRNQQLLQCRYTGDFDRPALAHVLDVLALSTNLRYEKHAGRYVFYGGGCPDN